MVGKGFVLCDQSAGANDAVASDSRPVQDNRAHADQRMIANPRAMHDGVMSDCDAGADDERKAGVGVADDPILDIGIFIDADRFAFAAQNSREPHAGIGGQGDIAKDHRAFGNPCAVGDFFGLKAGLVGLHYVIIADCSEESLLFAAED